MDNIFSNPNCNTCSLQTDITVGVILDINRQNRSFTTISNGNPFSIIQFNVPNNAQVILDAIDAGQTLGDIPIRVITSQNNAYGNWSRTQKSLLSLSSDSSQTYIENSTTAINASDVPTILSTIEDLINHIYELRDDY